MEGLIPLVCKTLKKSHTRRKYTCLSSSSAAAAAQSYNISDFYPQGFSYQYSTPQPEIQTSAAIGGVGRNKSVGHHHHRHNSSVGEYSSGFSGGGEQEMVIMKPKQLIRFRSHRFFSCVSGVA